MMAKLYFHARKIGFTPVQAWRFAKFVYDL